MITENPQIPNIDKIKARASSIQAICQRADANIVILDEIIRLLEENKKSSPVYQFRLNHAKRLLDFPQ